MYMQPFYLQYIVYYALNLLHFTSIFNTMTDIITWLPRRPVGTVLWKQGEHSRSALILEKGMLMNELEEEAGTKEQVRVVAGC
jgi:hypothetical protein